MLRGIFLFLSVLLFAELKSQDYLSVPSSNPNLFQLRDWQWNNEKVEVREDTFIYSYDTLELPFIDDFSVDHFPKRISSVENNPRLKDTTVYHLLINDVVYRDTLGFVETPTFVFKLDARDSVIQEIPNPPVNLTVVDISTFPTSSSNFVVYRALNIYDSLNGNSDTNRLEAEFVSDSATYYFVEADTNDYYTDRSAYRNTTSGINPPSVGVATFDGLDEFGMAYNFDNALRVKADYLTSVPINLSNLPDNNVFFSFFFQPQGLSIDAPEKEDSLVLDFFNVNTQGWTKVWDTIGYKSDTFLHKILRVPNDFQRNGFRFRFRNYANSTGAFDQWHIDYLYLNHGRSLEDTIYNDIAYVYDAPSLLKDYESMPWHHFVTDPASYMTDAIFTEVVNNANEERRVFNKVIIPDTVNNTTFYQYPTDVTAFVPFSAGIMVNLEHPINFTYPISAIDSAGTFEATYDIDFQPGPFEEKDFIRSNDTIIGKTVLENYYAYDDGTAEAGYGVNAEIGPEGLTAYMAVEFNIPFEDTIGGIDLYFLPQEVDVSSQSFELIVWNSLSPNGIEFRKPIKSRPTYSDDNAFVTYFFDSLVVVQQTFFVGIRTIGQRSLNIGYDLNTNRKDKIFWSQEGVVWNRPSNGIRDGSLMLRPIFRKRSFGVGVAENSIEEPQLVLYPNPTRGILNIGLSNEHEFEQIQILDLSGRMLVQQNFKSKIDVSQLKDGLYFLQLSSASGQFISKKFLIAH